jgi:hypothetical protein
MFWGPKVPVNDLFYVPFNKAEKLTKISDWTATIDKTKKEHSRENSFSLIDRQTILLRKSAIKNLKPMQKKQVQVKRQVRYTEIKPKAREASINVKKSWKVINTIEFSRMTNLYYDADDVEDL